MPKGHKMPEGHMTSVSHSTFVGRSFLAGRRKLEERRERKEGRRARGAGAVEIIGDWGKHARYGFWEIPIYKIIKTSVLL